MFSIIVLVLLATAHASNAAPLRVRVRGTAKLAARASRDQPSPGVSDLVLRGSLADDAGEPLAFEKVTIRILREADPHDPRVVDAVKAPRGCDTEGAGTWAVQAGGTNEVIVTTDDEGRFCFRVRIDPERYKASLVYAPSNAKPFIDGVERELAFDLSRRALALRFDPTPRIVELDTPRAAIEAVAIVDDDATSHVAPALNLILANEAEELARAVTDASGRARFVLPGTKLGPPGPGELRVSFAGDAETAGATHVEDIERHVKIAVKVPAAERGDLVAGVPEDGISLIAEVASSLGPIAEGTVQARIGDVLVGAAPVERGMARLTLTFIGQGNEALVTLGYIPSSPWYEPLGETTVRLPIRGPSLLSKAPIFLAGMVVLALFLGSRLSGKKRKLAPAPSKTSGDGREGKPRIDVLRPAESGHHGWTGRVVDAHEGTPVRGARVWIERGTFEGRSVLASIETDADGRFAIADIGPTSGGETIIVEAHLHARFAQDLPPPSEIAIAIAERRRVMLARLVTWARRRGPPFDAQPEPTPGHVKRAAGAESSTAGWADAVERTVFGPGEVDAQVEQNIERLAPKSDAG